MAEQFDVWGLTPVERETALSILRRHSHKRIASLAGRAALAAYFLESLIPSAEADSRP